MAVFDVSMRSSSLGHITHMVAVVPTERMAFPGRPEPEPVKDLRLLILLHGYSGIDTDWIRGSSIAELAMRHNIAVVMPDGGNSFYLDDEILGELYETLLWKEIPRFVRDTFPISARREDTFIGGFSMGGYGALRTALHHPEVFAGAIGLSSGLLTDQLSAMKHGDRRMMVTRLSYYEHHFGDLDQVKGSDFDPKALASKALALGEKKPALYIACGTEDHAIEMSRDFHAYLDGIGYEHTYEEGPGIHNFAFWDTYIKRALDWMDAQKA